MALDMDNENKSILSWFLAIGGIIYRLFIWLTEKLWKIFRLLFGAAAEALGIEIKKSPGLVGSFLLHLFLVLFLAGGLPMLFKPKEEEIKIIPIEMLPIKEITNLKPNDVLKDTPEQKEKKEDKKPPEEKKKEDKEKTPKPKEDKNKDAKKPDKKKDTKDKKKDDKKDKKDEDFDAVLKSVEKIKSEKQQKIISSDFDAEKPLSVSEVDAIVGQISKNWTIPSGAMDAENLIVALRIQLSADGTVGGVEIVDKSKYANDPVFRAAADSALRAVYKSSPLKGLPKDKYSQWKDMKINFNPKELF